jgi:trk system potassium uptake protein TrkH
VREPEHEYLEQRYAAILAHTGVPLILAGLLMLAPVLMLVFYPGEVGSAPAFVIPAGMLILLGLALRLGFRRAADVALSIQEGGVIVLLSWTTVILFSAWPFVAVLKLGVSRAIFESVSGWTTTGLSVVDVTSAGRLILFWRSVLQLAGGAGLAVIMMSAVIGPTGVGVPAAEGRGDQLVPHVRRSARLVLTIYGSYAVAGSLAYWWAGLSLFDAVNHSFAAISTGGFSTWPESIGHWDSTAVEAVSLPLMLLGNLSFVTAWLLWRGELRFVRRNGEVQLMAALIPLSAAAVFVLTCRGLCPHLDKALRVAVFETVSALTTTGFQTVSYQNWNGAGVLVLIVLMLIGGGTCSTAGGIKQFRIYVLWRQLLWDFRRALLPRTAVMERPVWEGRRRVYVDDARVRQITVFIFLYMMHYVLGTAILCACGFTLRDSMFEFASAIGTVGLSVGVTSATMPSAALWAEAIAMYLGRLEFLVVFVSVFKLVGDGRRLLGRRD